MRTSSALIFRGVLFLAGAFIVMTGLNIGLGGMLTLGWQGSNEFVAITDLHAYALQDSHIRFLGGLWLGLGLTLWAGSWSPVRLASALNLTFALIFIGGVTRLISSSPEVIFGPDIVGSLAAELIGMPLLYWWLTRGSRAQRSAAV
jgi:Domain of unknown function (DUF4345)